MLKLDCNFNRIICTIFSKKNYKSESHLRERHKNYSAQEFHPCETFKVQLKNSRKETSILNGQKFVSDQKYLRLTSAQRPLKTIGSKDKFPKNIIVNNLAKLFTFITIK